MDSSTGWAIVAVPEKDDYVWNISSEKIPHMTMLFLGEQSDPYLEKQIVDFLEHVAATSMSSFIMDVDRRDTLGENKADVLFFSNHSAKPLGDIRSMLLKNDAIKRAYDSTEQYPEWTPHLTLGYPETPAHPDNRDYPGISYIRFDRLFLWTGDFTGVEIPLKKWDDMEVSMSDVFETDPHHSAEDNLGHILSHHGVKGMRWGVSRTREQLATAKASRTDKAETKKSDRARPASSDAVAAGTHQRVARNAGLSKLSNKELQAAVTRMNLEQQYVRLAPKTKSQKAKKLVSDILVNSGKQQAQKYANDQIGSAIEKQKNKN